MTLLRKTGSYSLFGLFIMMALFSVPTLVSAKANTGSAGTVYPSSSSGSAGTVSPGGTSLFNPLGPNSNLNTFITNILTLVTDVIGPIVVVFMVVYSGFLYVVARGNPAKVGAAHQALLWTVVGGLILLGAKAIQLLIVATVQGLSG